MERERPDYLPPIPARRWSFPWLGLWAVFLLGMAVAGIWLHVRTNEAWTTRFSDKKAPIAAALPKDAEPAMAKAAEEERRNASVAEIRLRRAAAEREIQQRRAEIRCIGGVAFRRIPGGWENIPGETCP